VEFQILGGVEVSHAGSPLALGGPRHRRLLAVLLLSADDVVPTGHLIEALWGAEPPRSAAAMVHVRICELRAALRIGRTDQSAGLINRRGGYVLQLGDDRFDARQFEQLAAVGAQALADDDHAAARAQLHDALSLWRGPALVEFAGEPFAQTEAARLEALRMRALEGRLAADLALGGHAEIVEELQGLVAEHPLREPFWCQLILALYRSGRQADALAAFRAARTVLADQVGVEPGTELQRLHRAVLRQDPALDRHDAMHGPVPPPRRGNLPARLTSFVGREDEVAVLGALVREHRLVTLNGVGGAGKSRLALEVASAARPAFADGGWLVELAAVSQPDLVVQAVAAALAVREHPTRPLIEVLVEHLRDAEMLLVLDNCEHLVAEVAELADRLLSACEGLRILATSRERLGITGEVLRPVDGLDLPAAVRLLVERARAVRPEFALSGTTAGAVAEICRRLDGLPLAIELAAAGVNAFGVEQIAARLDDRFRLLTHGSRTSLPRHQTLRAAVEWSYGLLSEPERRLFDSLAVFVDGFTLEAAVELGADVTGEANATTVPDLLASLVDKSLVMTEAPAAPATRYKMLETLRDYGRERLDAAGRTAWLRDRHAAHVLSLVESAETTMHGRQQPIWLRRLEAEHGNIRAALAWSIHQHDADTANRLAGSLYPLWDRHGHYREGRRWLSDVLAMTAPVSAVARVHALHSAAALAVIQGDLGQAAVAAEEAAALSRQARYPAGVAQSLRHLGLAAIYAGDLDRATALLEESLHDARVAGDRWLEGFALLFLAVAALARADLRTTHTMAAECEAVLRPLGDPEGLSWTFVLRGAAAWRGGDSVSAATWLRESLLGFESVEHVWGISIGLFLAAQLAGERDDHDRAMRLLGASEALRESVGVALMPFLRVWISESAARWRAELGTAADEAWRAGRSMPRDAAMAEAMREAARE
jgi:predicted ATPase/DNA-binding SARP family transcriptional activator